MKNLLKADLTRIRRNKLFLISLLLAAAFPLLMALLYYGIEKLALLTAEDMAEMEALGLTSMFSSTTLLLSVFSLSNNLGMILPIFSCIFIGMDLSGGTLRNKIIIGKSRGEVYFSQLISIVLYNLVTVSLYFVSTLLFSGLFFGFESYHAVSFLYYLITGELTFAFVACLATALMLITKSTGLSIILTEVFSIGFSLITALLGLVENQNYRNLLYFVPTFSNTEGMLTYDSAPNLMFWAGVASYLVFGGLLTFLGLSRFRKKDLK